MGGSMRMWVLIMGMLLWSTVHIAPASCDVKVLEYWESMLHAASMPASIRAMVTPLDSHQTARFVIDINATDGFLPTHAAYFCKAARIQCYQWPDIFIPIEGKGGTKLYHAEPTDQEISVYHAEPMSTDQEISVYHAGATDQEISVYHAHEPMSTDQEISVYHAGALTDQEISVYHAEPMSTDQEALPSEDKYYTSISVKGATVYHTRLSAEQIKDGRTNSISSRARRPRLSNPISQMALSHFTKPTRLLTSNIGAAHGAIFFREHQTMVKGAEIQVNLSGDDGDIVDRRAFLPRELAQLFPFTSEGLPTIAYMLGVSEDALRRTMAHCDTKNDAMIGETRACVTSIEDLADFAASIMGTTKPIKVSEAPSHLGNYMRQLAGKRFTVLNVTTLNDDANNDFFISCHDLYFPFRVFFCHKTEQTKYFSVTLQATDGSKHDRIAICHYDTSYWDPSHPSFSQLRTKPGQTEACHWMGNNNWVFMYI